MSARCNGCDIKTECVVKFKTGVTLVQQKQSKGKEYSKKFKLLNLLTVGMMNFPVKRQTAGRVQ